MFTIRLSVGAGTGVVDVAGTVVEDVAGSVFVAWWI